MAEAYGPDNITTLLLIGKRDCVGIIFQSLSEGLRLAFRFEPAAFEDRENVRSAYVVLRNSPMDLAIQYSSPGICTSRPFDITA